MATQTVPKHTHHASPVHEPPAAIRATGIIVVLTVALAVVAIAFALPAVRSRPHDVPIGAAGPQAASGRIADMLEQHAPGAFDITYYPGEAALREAIRNRDVYGGVSFGPDGRALLVATGGSPMVAQMLTQVGNGIGQRPAEPPGRRHQTHCHCGPRTWPRRPPPIHGGPGWPRRRYRSPWPACCRQ